MNCQKQDCGRKATHYLALRIPAQGHSMKSALKVTVGLELCRDHAEEIVPRQIIDYNGEDMIRKTLRSMGLANPDFSRTEIEVRRIGDPNWTAFKQQRTH